MGHDKIKQSRLAQRSRAKESWEFRLIFLVGFIVFLVAAVIERVFFRGWRIAKQPGQSGKSIFKEAKEAAHASIPYAFMG